MYHLEKLRKEIFHFFVTKELFIAYLLVALILLGTGTAFFFQNNLLGWDHGGHLEAAEFIAKNSWPNPITWNSSYFNGFPENLLYPPLFSWLVATIALLLPITVAYKVIVLAIYFAAPFVFFRFARAFFEHKKALLVNLALIALFFVPDFLYYGSETGIGGTVHSIFFVGLVSSGLGFLLLLWFIQRCEAGASPLELGIIGALGILAHYIFLVAFLYLFLRMIVTKDIKRSLSCASIAFVLSAWWLVPFLYYYYWLVSAQYAVPLLNITSLAIVLGILALLSGGGKAKERVLVISALILYVGVLIFADATVKGQLFRVFLAIVFFTIPIITTTIDRIHALKKARIVSQALPLLLAGIILVCSLSIQFTSVTHVTFTTPIQGNDAIVMVIGPTTIHEDHHALFYSLVDQKNYRVLRGLFAEQSPNIVVSTGMYLFANPDEFVWGATALRGDKISPANIVPLFNHFGVSSVITTEPISQALPVQKARYLGTQGVITERHKFLWFDVNTQYEERPIIEYFITDTNNVEVLTSLPYTKASSDPWDLFSSVYLSQNNHVVTETQVQGAHVDTNATAQFIRTSATTFTVNVDANTNVPILVKESYFPNWHAYNNGKEIPIYLTAPYFMVVVGNGDIEFKYEPSLVEQLSWVLSGVALLGIVVWVLHFKKEKTKGRTRKK